MRPDLPGPRGPLSGAVLALLRGDAPPPVDPATADPFGDDLHLALYCCYEMHYRGFRDVRDELEWDPALLELRRGLEAVFLRALREAVPPPADLATTIDRLLVEPVDAVGVSHHLRRSGEVWQVREYVAQRSLYHLKEGDPQAFVIARLDGQAKSALVSVEHDEYGAGDHTQMHAHLFAEMMRALGLDAAYGAYLDTAPAPTLAEVNFMSLCGLHRELRGALVGQFAAVELTSSPGSERLLRAMRRLDLPEAAARFYDEHVEADAVHEQVVRRGVVGPLVAAEPELAADIVFGVDASILLAGHTEDLLLRSWADDRSALRRPLPQPVGDSGHSRVNV